ncbi:MAG: iron-containing alcohol dehydrogenase [Ruminococcaceae bacterium]|nr:iron-containing alcohol dehydrogenase [Oscillospiraceae bacterium]
MKLYGSTYEGACACGKVHKAETELCIVEAGCLGRLDTYLSENGFSGRGVAIFDDNTYEATKAYAPIGAEQIVLPAKGLHGDDHAVALAEQALSDLGACDYLIAVGGGTIHDITRFCAFRRGIPFVSVPTAASADGFCSSVVALTFDGFKNSLTTVAPRLVVADLNVIANAPFYLTCSGVGDMIGKYNALAEWRMSHILTGEVVCERIYELTRKATDAVLESADGLVSKDMNAFANLMCGLLLSGMAMQLLGHSRCASGAEHHISHLIEMHTPALNYPTTALHGESVGVGMLLAVAEYHRMAGDPALRWGDYPIVTEKELISVFGERIAPLVIKGKGEDAYGYLTGEHIAACWPAMRAVIAELPTVEALLPVYRKLGMKQTLSDLGVPETEKERVFAYSPMVSNRLTLMRLRRAIRIGEGNGMTVYTKRGELARSYFKEGYNCAQSVALAFADLVGLEKTTLLRLASPFGGGMGRMREVCGAVSGALMIEGLLCGYDCAEDGEAKMRVYAEVRQLADAFRAENGSIICRELLEDVPHTDGPCPEARTAAYYHKRPCAELVAVSASILETSLKEKGLL